MSPCGLLAHAIDNTLTIYADSNTSQYAPAFTWVPFEYPITAMCWYDASDVPDLTLPILVFASESKRVCVFDLAIRKVIASMQLQNSYASVIKWSPISSSRFFIGTRSGDVLCCSMKTDDEGKLIFKIDWLISVNFDVNYLTFEPSFGDTLAVCSKSGSFSFIKRVHSKSPVLIPESYSFCNDNNNEIYSCEFLESSSNYMVFVTKLGTILYTIAEKETITLFNDVKLKDLFPVMSHGRRLIGINDHIIALYELVGGKVQRLCEIQIMPSINSSHNDYVTSYVYKNDKLVFVSYNWWLTTIKIINKKLFVVNRVRLLHEKPLDFAPRNGGLLFSTCNGYIMATKPTPLAQKRPTRSSKSLDYTNSNDKQIPATINKANININNKQNLPYTQPQAQNKQTQSISTLSPQQQARQTENVPGFSQVQPNTNTNQSTPQNLQQQPQNPQNSQNSQNIPSFAQFHASSAPGARQEEPPSFPSGQPSQKMQGFPSMQPQQGAQVEKVPGFGSMQPSQSAQGQKMQGSIPMQPQQSPQGEKVPGFSSMQQAQGQNMQGFPSMQPQQSPQGEKVPGFGSMQLQQGAQVEKVPGFGSMQQAQGQNLQGFPSMQPQQSPQGEKVPGFGSMQQAQGQNLQGFPSMQPQQSPQGEKVPGFGSMQQAQGQKPQGFPSMQPQQSPQGEKVPGFSSMQQAQGQNLQGFPSMQPQQSPQGQNLQGFPSMQPSQSPQGEKVPGFSSIQQAQGQNLQGFPSMQPQQSPQGQNLQGFPSMQPQQSPQGQNLQGFPSMQPQQSPQGQNLQGFPSMQPSQSPQGQNLQGFPSMQPSQSPQGQNLQGFPSMQPQQSPQGQNLQGFPSMQPSQSPQGEKVPGFSSMQQAQGQNLQGFPSMQPQQSPQGQNLLRFPSMRAKPPPEPVPGLPMQSLSTQGLSSIQKASPREHGPTVSFVGLPTQMTMRVPSMSTRSRRRISMSLKYSNDESQGQTPPTLVTGNKLNEKFDVEVNQPSPPHVEENDKMQSAQNMKSGSMNTSGKYSSFKPPKPPPSDHSPKTAKRLSDSSENRPPPFFSSSASANIPLSKDEHKFHSSTQLIKQNNAHPGRLRTMSTINANEKNQRREESKNQSSDEPNSSTNTTTTNNKASQHHYQGVMYGNSRQFNVCFKITDIPLLKVDWCGPSRIFAYGSVRRGDRYVNKLFVLDLKTRVVHSILENRLHSLNMPITEITLNATKKIVAVILNDTVVNFISLTSTPPKVISTINFTSSTRISFSPDGNRAAILSDKNIYLTESIDPKVPNIKFKESHFIDIKYNITAFLWKRANLIAGTDDGKIIFINFENNISKVSEVLSVKHPIVSIVDFENSMTQTVVTDSKHNVYITSHKGIEKTIPYPVSCIKQVSQTDFLVRFHGKSRLSAYNINNRPIPVPSPIINKCVIMKSRDEWASLLAHALTAKELQPVHIAELFGMPLARKILMNLEYPDFTREQMTLIRDIILADSDLNDLAIHLCLDLGEVDGARTIAFKTDGKSPSFVLNIFKAVLFETSPPEQVVQAAIVHLITEGKAQDAIDLLLIIGKLKVAVEKLMSIDELKEAQCILKMRIDDDKSLEGYMWDIAQRFIESGRLGAGLILYALSGGLRKVADFYRELGETEQAQFLTKVLM